MRKFLILFAAAGLIAGSACGGGGSGSAKTTTTAGGAAPAATIDAEGTTWNPDDVKIKAGDTVAWVVDGSIVHDLKGDDGVSHKAASKYTVTHTYAKRGTFSYQCTIHAGMTGTVEVS